MSLKDVVFFTDAGGRRPVVEYLESLPPKARVHFARNFQLLQEFGLSLGEPHRKHVHGKLHELRISWNKNAYRVFFVVDSERRAVLLHIFQKTTQRLPQREIETALKRWDQHISR